MQALIWYALLIACAVGIVIAPRLIAARRRPVEDRKGAPGEIVELSQGKTHIHLQGNRRGPMAVLVHGLTTPEFVWDQLVPGLTELGFRIVSYDLYGRGYSDRPDGKQDRAFFLQQLEDVLAEADAPDSITLIGFSMGGAIATAFASSHPDRVERLILLAPAGLLHNQSRLALFLRDVPFVGDWLMEVGGSSVCRSGILGPLDTSEISRRQREEVDYRGFLRAVLSSQRNMLRENQTDDHNRLENERVPVLAIWGEEDTVIPIKALGLMTQANRSTRHAQISGAGHSLPYTHPTEIISSIRDFLGDR